MNDSKHSRQSKSSNADDRDSQVDQEQGRFIHNRGLIRGEWFDMICDDFISGKDMVLLRIIHSLTTSEEGCWSSNAYLARSVKAKKRYMPEMIQRLKDKGLIEIKYGLRDGKNCRWMWLVPEGQSHYKPDTAYHAPYVRTKSPTDVSVEGASVQHTDLSEHPPTDQSVPPLQTHLNQYKNKENEESEEKKHTLLPPASGGADAPPSRRVNGVPAVQPSTKQTTPPKKTRGGAQTTHKQNNAAQTIDPAPAQSSTNTAAAPRGFLNTDLGQDHAAQMAKHLHAALQKHNKLQRRADLKKWTAAFAKLADEVIGGVPRLQEALDWYCDHLNEKYAPQAYSANSFAEKYEQVVAAMERNAQKDAPDDEHLSPDDLSPEVREAYERVARLNWPNGSRDGLIDVVKDSYCFYAAFRKSLGRLFDDGKTAVGELAEHLHATLSPPDDFVPGWYEEFNDSVRNWTDWSGRLPVCSLKEKRFTRILYGMAEQYFGNSVALKELFKRIGGSL